MSQDDSSRILSPAEEFWKIIIENHEDRKKLREALGAYLEEKSKNPPPMPPERNIKHIPFSQLPKIIRATPESTGREEIIEWVGYYGTEEEKLLYLKGSPKKRKEIIGWIKYRRINDAIPDEE
jgi:hypothetical protein